MPTPAAVLRGVSGPGDPAAVLSGAQYQPQFASRVELEGTALKLLPDTDSADLTGLAWAAYVFSEVDPAAAPSLRLSWKGIVPPAGTRHVALGNFSLSRWDWFKPEGGVAVFPEELSDYIAGDSTLLVLVAISSGDPQLSTLALGTGQQPVAVLTVAPESMQAPVKPTLDASDSFIPLGPAVKYEWDIDGDGDFDEETIVPTYTPALTITTPGSHTYAVRVTAPGGLTDTAQAQLLVTGEVVSWRSDSTATSGTPHLTVTATCWWWAG